MCSWNSVSCLHEQLAAVRALRSAAIVSAHCSLGHHRVDVGVGRDVDDPDLARRSGARVSRASRPARRGASVSSIASPSAVSDRARRAAGVRCRRSICDHGVGVCAIEQTPSAEAEQHGELGERRPAVGRRRDRAHRPSPAARPRAPSRRRGRSAPRGESGRRSSFRLRGRRRRPREHRRQRHVRRRATARTVASTSAAANVT